MAVTVEGAIYEVLRDRLSTLVLSPAHPVSWPGYNFTKPANRRYLQALFVPNTVTRAFIGSTDPQRHIGFLQVNVRDSDGSGLTRILDTAGAVAAHFPTDLRLTHASGIEVRITSKPDVSAPITENNPAGILVPVLIPYECFA